MEKGWVGAVGERQQRGARGQRRRRAQGAEEARAGGERSSHFCAGLLLPFELLETLALLGIGVGGDHGAHHVALALQLGDFVRLLGLLLLDLLEPHAAD